MQRNSPTLSIVVLAAGKGTRMKSALPKVFHKIAGREMINLVIDTAYNLNPSEISVVISEEMKDFFSQKSNKLKLAVQKEPKGTADAVKIGINSLEKISDIILVLYADTPLLHLKTLQKMIDELNNNAICTLGFDYLKENKYGRLITDKNKLLKIVEFKDATPEERKITLCNSGVIAIAGDKIKNLLSLVKNDNAAGEYYLTDIISIAKKKGLECSFIKASEKEVMGVNSRIDLSMAESAKQNELRTQFMEEGVTMIDPNSVYFSFDTKIASDVIIYPNVFFGPDVEIKSDVKIKSFSDIEGVLIKSGAVVGPFARIRPGTIIGKNVKIGNFVEIKKSHLASGVKISHLSYIGDSEIGDDSNIGAGTITCNYDGYKKFPTKIGKDVFIGSNTALIAPLNIGDNAVIGAGSVITKNVESSNLAIARVKQIDFKNGGKNYHQRRKNSVNR